eukprot:Nk52_evm16s2531 gene=Nk52_evmTU16s2531
MVSTKGIHIPRVEFTSPETSLTKQGLRALEPEGESLGLKRIASGGSNFSIATSATSISSKSSISSAIFKTLTLKEVKTRMEDPLLTSLVSDMSKETFQDDITSVLGKGGWEMMAFIQEGVADFRVGAYVVYRKQNRLFEIGKIQVAEEFRRLGLGRKLMKRVSSKAKSSKIYVISLWAYDEAVGFYLKLNFQIKTHQEQTETLENQTYMELYLKKPTKKAQRRR